LDADILWRPAHWKTKVLRPLDYVAHVARDWRALKERRPPFVMVQTPPHAVAFAPRYARVPYVVDAHNAQFQSWWARAPGAEHLLRAAQLVVTHTAEADAIARTAFPGLRTLVVQDPLRIIPSHGVAETWVFVVASVSADEPLDVLLDAMAALPDVTFATTAPVARLPVQLRRRALELPNLRLIGFLSVPDYEAVLAQSKAILVLTSRAATQPSGACEALSALKPLVVSRTETTEALFGNFATLVENDRDDLMRGIRTAVGQTDRRPITAARAAWMRRSDEQLRRLNSALALPNGTS
jgi:glycosyltransferase involved in cell wall biosynthesis